MFEKGLLAVDNIAKLAKAHVCVYEEMDYGASGRYFSFEKVITGSDEMRKIKDELKMHGIVPKYGIEVEGEIESRLTNARLHQLVARSYSRCCRQ